MGTLKAFWQKFNNDWSMNLAGMLTYSLITTIFPLIIGIFSVAAIVLNLFAPSQIPALATELGKALPGSVAGPGKAIDTSALLRGVIHISGPLAIISLAALLWTGSNLFTNMENAFSVVFRMPDRGFVPQRLMGMGMVIILAIMLPLSLAASGFITAGSATFSKVLPPPLGVLLSVVGPLTSLLILWVLFLIIYKVVPNTHVPFALAWRGALAAAILFAVLQLLFPLYFKFFLSGNAKYGAAAATILVVVAWLWLFALFTMIGAQVNAVAMGLKPSRFDLARTLCLDYRENIAQDGQTPTDSSKAPAKGPAGQSRPKASSIR